MKMAVVNYFKVVSILSVLSYISAFKLPLPWCLHLAKVCNEFDDKNPAAPAVVAFESWSPLEQLGRIKVACPKCTA